jgi:hypothetical protein
VIHALRVSLAVALCALPACDSDDAPESAADATAPASEVPARPESDPWEFADLKLRRAVTAQAFSELLDPLLKGQGTVTLGPGITIEVSLDPATAERRVGTVLLAPAGAGEPETLLRVPLSAAYLELFMEAAVQGLAATDGQANPTPFLATYDVVSPHGGGLTFRVTPGRMDIELRSMVSSLASDRLNGPLPGGGDAHEVVSIEARLAMDYLTLRQLVLSVFDPTASGVNGDLCGALNDYAGNEPHTWYSLCIRVDDPLLPVSVDVDLVTRDGRKLPIARSPGGLRTAMLWLTAMDRVAAAARQDADEDAQVLSSAFDYRDPKVQGGAVFTASSLNGKIVFDHRSITPPSALPDVAPVERPVPRPLVPLPDDPCPDLGSVAALKGTIIVDAKLDAAMIAYSDFNVPLAGAVRASIYKAEDVTIAGPREGAEVFDTFAIEDLALGTDAPAGRHVSPELRAGTYMVLGYYDVGGDADADDPQPVAGEPVSLPLRRIELQCAEQPATLLFDAPFPG